MSSVSAQYFGLLTGMLTCFLDFAVKVGHASLRAKANQNGSLACHMQETDSVLYNRDLVLADTPSGASRCGTLLPFKKRDKTAVSCALHTDAQPRRRHQIHALQHHVSQFPTVYDYFVCTMVRSAEELFNIEKMAAQGLCSKKITSQRRLECCCRQRSGGCSGCAQERDGAA